MYKITIKGEAQTDYLKPSELDGIDCQDEFSEYFGRKYGEQKNEQDLIDKGVCNGYLYFKYEDGKLWAITTYDSPEKLTEEEIKALAEYTQAQWSDGIGEGFEQHPCYDGEDGEEVYISPWHQGQELITEQIETKEKYDNSSAKKRQEKDKKISDLSDRVSKTLKDAEDLLRSLGIDPNKL